MPPHPAAILAATAVSYIAGSLWYLALGKRWQTAVLLHSATSPYRPRITELVIALAGQLILATSLAVLLALLHLETALAGLEVAAAAWFGFVLPTLATNVIFQRRSLSLLWMDGGHWLLILALQGAILGALG